ncbi:MAG: hypothetical protein SPL08_01935 [Pseudomonadota bacterium]|nr:hypothetical protein [Pseudomonadota bacterium]
MQDLKTMQKQLNKNGKCTVSIGCADLSQDATAIQTLLQLKGSAGVVLDLGGELEGKICWRARPFNSQKEVVKTMRKFLTFISVMGGIMPLTAVRDKLPEKAIDFDWAYQQLKRDPPYVLDRGD